MKLPLFHSAIRELQLMNSQWKAILDPIISIPMLAGNTIKGVSVVSGNNTINHLLGAPYQGYLVTGMRGGFVQLYDAGTQTPATNLVLHSNGSATIDLLVW